MSVPIQPAKAELEKTLRRRVERYTNGAGADTTEDDDSLRRVSAPESTPGPDLFLPSTSPPADGAPTPEPEDEHEVYSIGAVFGGVSGAIDTGLPGVAFVVTYALSDSNLRLAVIIAVSLGAVLAVLRVIRKQSLQYALSGFFGVALAAYIASRTGRAVDYYAPGLFINAGYALAYLVSILVRWPLIGLLVAAVQQKDLGGWRRDPVLMRAYTRATWLWVGMFLLKLAVQLPLYLADQLGAIATARIAMGWPLLLATVWLTYLVIKRSVPPGYKVRKLPDSRAAAPSS